MSEPRVFVSAQCDLGAQVELERDDSRHLALVLRMKPGEHITIVAGGRAWRAELTQIHGDRASARIIEPGPQASPELPIDVTVLQAVPKGTKMDDVVEKVVELGASRIVPMRCARSYGGDSANKIERWRRIARAAAQQSQRSIVPVVEEPLSFSEAIGRFAAISQVILAHERAQPGSLAAALRNGASRPIALAVGPEGSFTDDELREARDAGCDIASLGPTILRTETAAAAMLAAIAALRAWW